MTYEFREFVSGGEIDLISRNVNRKQPFFRAHKLQINRFNVVSSQIYLFQFRQVLQKWDLLNFY